MGSLKSFPSKLLVVLSARCPGTTALAIGAARTLQRLLWAGPRLAVSRARQCSASPTAAVGMHGLSPAISPTAPDVSVCSTPLSDRAASLPAAGSKVQLFTWNSVMLVSPLSVTGRIPPCGLMF